MANLTPTSLLSDALFVADLFGLGVNVDTVGVFDASTFEQVFSDARPLRANVKETSKVMEHPAENGVLISDHHIINQVEIELALMIASPFYGSTYQQIRSAFLEGTLLTVQTRTGVYTNMVVADLPHEESADVYDAVTMGLHLKQVIFVPDPSTYAPVDPNNTDTVQSGLQSAGTLTTQAVAGAGALVSYASLRKFL